MQHEQLKRIGGRALETSKKLLAIALYIWVLLTLFALHKALLLGESNLGYHIGFAFLNALALAKVVFVGQELRIGDKLRNRPLIVPILFKAAIFAGLLFFFRVVEETVLDMWHGKSAAQGVAAFFSTLGGAKLTGTVLVCTIMFVALIPFFAYLEIEQVIGAQKLRSILFGGQREKRARTQDEDAAAAPLSQPQEATPQVEDGASAGVWYYEKAGSVVGPITWREMQALLKSREIDGDTLIYNTSTGEQWQRLQDTFLDRRV